MMGGACFPPPSAPPCPQESRLCIQSWLPTPGWSMGEKTHGTLREWRKIENRWNRETMVLACLGSFWFFSFSCENLWEKAIYTGNVSSKMYGLIPPVFHLPWTWFQFNTDDQKRIWLWKMHHESFRNLLKTDSSPVQMMDLISTKS